LLAGFTADIIKFDMALVRTVESRTSRQGTVRCMVRICQALGIQVIAEGIETAAERDLFLSEVLSEGVTLMQGFLFGKPAFRAVAPAASVAWPGSPQW
jgi:EAL domain-containing protein (putative c-di-GMP-specific phosphodiesterase class I)